MSDQLHYGYNIQMSSKKKKTVEYFNDRHLWNFIIANESNDSIGSILNDESIAIVIQYGRFFFFRSDHNTPFGFPHLRIIFWFVLASDINICELYIEIALIDMETSGISNEIQYMNVKCEWAMYGNFNKHGNTFICRPISNGSFWTGSPKKDIYYNCLCVMMRLMLLIFDSRLKIQCFPSTRIIKYHSIYSFCCKSVYCLCLFDCCFFFGCIFIRSYLTFVRELWYIFNWTPTKAK